jgi:hypothetical protein
LEIFNRAKKTGIKARNPGRNGKVMEKQTFDLQQQKFNNQLPTSRTEGRNTLKNR